MPSYVRPGIRKCAKNRALSHAKHPVAVPARITVEVAPSGQKPWFSVASSPAHVESRMCGEHWT